MRERGGRLRWAGRDVGNRQIQYETHTHSHEHFSRIFNLNLTYKSSSSYLSLCPCF